MKASDYGLKWPGPPAPPKPPEPRLQCTCGFTAPESEFKIKHKRCWPQILSLIVAGLIILSLVGTVIFKMLKGFGVI